MSKEQECWSVIDRFIEVNGYAWSVNDVVLSYKNCYGKYYVSYTMKRCIENCLDELKIICK